MSILGQEKISQSPSISVRIRVKWRDARIKVRALLAQNVLEKLAPWFYRFKFRHPPRHGESIWIDPKSIKIWWRQRPSDLVFEGQVKAGSWHERRVVRVNFLEESFKAKGIAERFRDGRDWADTTLYKKYLSDLKERPYRVFGHTEQSLLDQCTLIDQLFLRIKAEGFLEADTSNGISAIYVHIGPEGELIYTDGGNHRLAIALLLGIDSMPVRVLRRHRHWQDIRDKVLAVPTHKLAPELKKYVGHPDLLR